MNNVQPSRSILSFLPLAGLLVVAAFALRRLDDFDTWWHLAAGRWILENRSIPSTDVLSFTVPTNEWVNLQWLYDLLLYVVYGAGGASSLVLLSTGCFVLAFALLAANLRRHAGPVGTTLILLWVAMTVNERFLIRPEMATFPLLAAVQLVLADGRDKPGRLRWLVPLMIAWANLHSLFILGVGAIGCAIAGALVAELPVMPAAWRRDSAWPARERRELFVWGGAAMVATLVNPYFVQAILFPLELMSRIDGSSGVYSVIGEFRPPFAGYFPTFALGSYQAFVFFFLGVSAVAGALRAFTKVRPRDVSPREGFDVGVFAFAAMLAWLSLMARRNVGVFALGAAPFVGACVGILASRLPKAWRDPDAVPAKAAGLAVAAAALAITGFVLTNGWYARTGETHEFGLGVFESNFQSRATDFFVEQKLPGPLYNDMTAGGWLTWADPTGKGVYVDGRLEVYDTPFFSSYLTNQSNIAAWKKDADARGIQSVMIFHRWLNRHGFVRALMGTAEWRLVYYDETAAILVRATEHPKLVMAARDAFSSKWRPRTEEVLSSPPQTASWQWSIDRYTAILAYASFLETLGERQEALRHLEKAVAVGLPPIFDVETRQRAAEIHAGAGQFAQARVHLVRAAEVDPDNPVTRDMLTRLDAIAR